MPLRKLLYSGSNAELASLRVDNAISASQFSGSYFGNGSGITGVVTSSFAISASWAPPSAASVTASYALTASYLDNSNLYYIHTQSISSNIWTINHNLGADYVNVTVWSASKVIIPEDIESTGFNSLNVAFPNNQVGYVVVSRGSYTISNSISSSYALSSSYIAWQNVDQKPNIISGSSQIDHGLIGGLLDNDHPQYVLNSITSSMTVLSSSYALTASYLETIPTSISPSEIAGILNNYNPTGFSTSDVVLLSGSAFDGITGFDSSGVTAWKPKILINSGTTPLYFSGMHPSSSINNRIISTQDIILSPYKTMGILYDNISNKWRISSYPSIDTAPQRYRVDGGSITAADWGDLAFNVNGTSAANTTVGAGSGVPNYFRHNTGTTSTGQALIYFLKSALTYGIFGSCHAYFDAEVSIEALSDGTDTFTLSCGLTSAPSTATTANGLQNNSVSIVYRHNLNSGNWTGMVINNAGSQTTVDLGVAVAANTLYKVRVEINYARTEARFYVNDVMRECLTAGMPNNAVGFGGRVCMAKSVGGNARYARTYYMETGAYFL